MVSRETLKRAVAVIGSVIVLSTSLIACSDKKYTHDEILEALNTLIPASYELNEIYFGEGLDVSGDIEDIKKFYDSFDVDVASLKYYPVSADCKYQTETDLKEATEAVFTKSYCDYLYEMAFSGISAVFNEGNAESQYTETSQYAKYIESSGVLTVRLDIADEAYNLNREYIIDEFSVISQNAETVKVSVPSTVDGVRDIDITLTLRMTENGFRLDSPTY